MIFCMCRDIKMMMDFERHQQNINNIDKYFKKYQMIPTYSKKSTEEDCCSICYEDYGINDNIIYLNCKHYYHYKCIDLWIKNCPEENKRKCVYCQAQF